MKNKKWWLFGLFVLLLIITVGCSGGSDESSSGDSSENDSDKVELDLVYTGDPAWRQVMDEVISSFNEEHPDIVINGESATDGSYSEYLRTKDATGEFPDIFELMDVQEYYESDKLAPMPDSLSSLIRNPVEFDGTAYVLPTSATALGYIYNKKFFEENGLNQEPKTYDEFLEVMNEVKNLGETPIAVGGQDVWHMGFWLNHFLINNIFAEDRNWNAKVNSGEASWTDEEPTEAMNQMMDLFESGVVSDNWISTPDNQLAALVTSGKAMGFFSGPWMFTQLKEADPEFEIGYMPVPDQEGNINLFTGGTGAGWALSKTLEDEPEKMEAATAFYQYFYQPDVYKKVLEKMGSLPVTVEEVSYDGIDAQERLIETYNNADATVPPINEMLGENQIPPSFRDWFYKTVQEWILSDADVEEELPKVEAEWERLQGQE
ncbi:ABC transporter substrate-binding protein [Gracilibacillus salinarum]|uniref:Extracellular solute-binding protein n=1 Tax=Gracilibacillus salinarum TaxID=2932255 RepID=A0ABY4GK74_9BACI|nr:extracellular solute-binding protein [Gracilibacillus salinarum]UOQ84763.1 extracellular solute-binding protein [Gracilibacillus salinarum]